MLGGSFWTAFLRNGISAGLIMLVFLLLDRPKLPMKKQCDTISFSDVWFHFCSASGTYWMKKDLSGFPGCR